MVRFRRSKRRGVRLDQSATLVSSWEPSTDVRGSGLLQRKLSIELHPATAAQLPDGKTVNYKSKRNSKSWEHDQGIHNDRRDLCRGRKASRHAHTDRIDQVGHAENVNGIGERSSQRRVPPKRDGGNYCEQPRERVADTGRQCKEAGKKAIIPERQENNSAVYADRVIRDQPP